VPDWVSKMNHGPIDTLDLHFHCLGERVACSQVKPCLPGLLAPSVHLRIPTPITVHIDQCHECSADLGALRKLALDAGQLARLQWLYSQRPGNHPLLCCRARARIREFVTGAWERIEERVLEHLCTCPQCRAEVYVYRQYLLDEGLTPQEQPGVSDACCRDGGIGDLFDYVVPSRHAERPDTSHVGTCRPCLEKIQRLHRVIYGVAERPESGVTTVYTTVDDADPMVTQPEDAYARYAIRVQVARRKTPPAVIPSCAHTAHAGAEKRRWTWGRRRLRDVGFDPRVRMMLRTVITAAAMVALAVLFLSTPSSPAGVALADVVRAVEQAKNVRVLRYDSYGGEVIQQLLILRDSDLVYMAIPGQCTMYDLGARRKALVGVDSRLEHDESLSRREYVGVRDIVDGCIGFRLSKMPADARWDRVSGADGQDVYELMWSERTGADLAFWVRGEIVLDGSTRRPIRVSLFHRDSRAVEWRQISRIVFEYPSDAEMKSTIESGSFLIGASTLL